MNPPKTYPIDCSNRELTSVDSLQVLPKYKDELEGILISGGEVKSRLKALRAEISAYYEQFISEGEKEIEVIGFPLLGGAMYFYSTLIVGEFDKVCFPQVLGLTSSYDGTNSTGKINRGGYSLKELQALKGKRVLIIEDIVDTGLTLKETEDWVHQFSPLDVKICCLLDKTLGREVKMESDFTGFTIPNEFIVGCGLDLEGRYRDLGHIAVLKKEYQ